MESKRSFGAENLFTEIIKRKKMIKTFSIIFYVGVLCFYTISALAWNNVAHRVIAVIAYQHLDPQVRFRVDYLTHVIFKQKTSEYRFLQASVWPDAIKMQNVTAFDDWHFINIPYFANGIKGRSYDKKNVAWAVQQSFKVLASPKANRFEKAIFLSFLIHFVGDAHQPLHCIDRYSKQFPVGDFSGNRFLIQYPGVTNLHSFWDSGGGLFLTAHRFHYHSIEKIALQIEQEYPLSYYRKRASDLDPWSWVFHSYDLAKISAYDIKPNSAPTSKYVKMVRIISKQQIALAAYHLATMLNIALKQ